jgi:hypothetical protein
MGTFESFGTAMFTMVVVFLVLACLYVLIKVFSFFIRIIESAISNRRNNPTQKIN